MCRVHQVTCNQKIHGKFETFISLHWDLFISRISSQPFSCHSVWLKGWNVLLCLRVSEHAAVWCKMNEGSERGSKTPTTVVIRDSSKLFLYFWCLYCRHLLQNRCHHVDQLCFQYLRINRGSLPMCSIISGSFLYLWFQSLNTVLFQLRAAISHSWQIRAGEFSCRISRGLISRFTVHLSETQTSNSQCSCTKRYSEQALKVWSPHISLAFTSQKMFGNVISVSYLSPLTCV